MAVSKGGAIESESVAQWVLGPGRRSSSGREFLRRLAERLT